jgi:NAD(P)-dependent dehydrogenase (short-subunit alcohol dehydrogenase family)
MVSMPPEISPLELEICLKVLQQVADDPEMIDHHNSFATVSDNTVTAANRFKSLVTKIHKTAKKNKRKSNQIQYRQHDRSIKESTEIVRAQQAQLTLPSANLDEELHQTCNCYICKQPYRQIHHFYHQLCPPCAELNFAKRQQHTDLTHRIALVTGGRIKIGFQMALRLLQDGARVIVTTRFPQDAAQRFSQEPDFDQWRNRLQIYGLDLRQLPAVEIFIQDLLNRESSLDILINNAAQTIKRPLAFYQKLLQSPAELAPELQQLLPSTSPMTLLEKLETTGLTTIDPCFPLDQLDAEGQPIDLRPTNSWKLKLDNVDTVELVEVQLVNAIAPFMLNSKLKPLLLRSPHQRRFIINVSAMEGQFGRTNKTIYHPHTNMAKAALNMMTRTSAADYARDGIYMNSVDTGWITDENPYNQRNYARDVQGFYPPLDIIDGMARIYDPIVQGLNQPEQPIHGCFLKDYAPYDW